VHFVPIPTTPEHLIAWAPHWLPFLEGVSRGCKEPVASIRGRIERFDVQLALIWDGRNAHALIGIQFTRRGDELIGEIIWLTGKDRRRWLHLLPEVEQYLKDMGCAVIRPICRPGWWRLIEPHGYRRTHYVLEKAL
jgi:hypothetical protein